jgi:hypothetical protein
MPTPKRKPARKKPITRSEAVDAFNKLLNRFGVELNGRGRTAALRESFRKAEAERSARTSPPTPRKTAAPAAKKTASQKTGAQKTAFRNIEAARASVLGGTRRPNTRRRASPKFVTKK